MQITNKAAEMAAATAAIKTVRPFMSKQQMAVMAEGLRDIEGSSFMESFVKMAGVIEAMPKTYEQDGKGGQAVAHLRIVKLRPEHAGRIEQLDSPADGKPLVLPGHTRPIGHLSAATARHAVDKRGFARIGDADNHHAQRAARHPFFQIGLDFIPQQFAHRISIIVQPAPGTAIHR
mgnify:CR=1 FL=1